MIYKLLLIFILFSISSVSAIQQNNDPMNDSFDVKGVWNYQNIWGNNYYSPASPVYDINGDGKLDTVVSFNESLAAIDNNGTVMWYNNVSNKNISPFNGSSYYGLTQEHSPIKVEKIDNITTLIGTSILIVIVGFGMLLIGNYLLYAILNVTGC